jgi:hypothetical protein
MVMTIIQFAVYAHAQHVAQAVAAQALTAARIHGGTDQAGRTTGQELAGQLGGALTAPAVEVHRVGGQVTVTVTGIAQTVVPGVRLPVTVRDTGPIETVAAR